MTAKKEKLQFYLQHTISLYAYIQFTIVGENNAENLFLVVLVLRKMKDMKCGSS